jgi:hypothetical protein
MGADVPERARHGLPAEDAELVDLLTAVLVDPNLHTDRRMRLHHEISAVLRAIQRDLYGESGGESRYQAIEADTRELPDLLTTVLVDPNLHSDLRMRIHRDIRTILSGVQAQREG